MILVYFSNTGQTRKFINKTGIKSYEIEFNNPFFEVDDYFVLVSPSYEPEATDHALDFLETGNNLDYFLGVVGSGNRNFSDLFCYTAKDIAVEYNKPYLYEFEFQGMEKDVIEIRKIMKNIDNGDKYLTPLEMGYNGSAKGHYKKGEVEISNNKEEI